MPSTEVVKVNVRNIAVGGAGVGEVIAQESPSGELLGITAFVPFSAVGETVAARITERKKRYVNAELVKIEKFSVDRCEPRCRHFTACGGCELQHINYGGQLSAKFEMVRSALKAGRLTSETIGVLHPVIGGEEYGYRRRVTLHVDAAGKVGLYRTASRSVVSITECPISVPAIHNVLSTLQEFGRAIKGKISSIVLEADEDGLVAVLKTPYDLASAESQAVLASARQFFTNVSLMSGEKEIGGYGRQILELPLGEHGGMTFRVPAGSFSQANWAINQALIGHVIEASGARRGIAALDLYAGAGNFSLPLARAGAEVTAVECDPRLVLFGRENAARNGIEKRLEFVEMSAEKFVQGMGHKRKYDVIVADPPRSGLGSLVNNLPESKKLLFISCHLPSFVRDLKILSDQGWTVTEIQPYDMFAQTSYIEILGVLEKG